MPRRSGSNRCGHVLADTTVHCSPPIIRVGAVIQLHRTKAIAPRKAALLLCLSVALPVSAALTPLGGEFALLGDVAGHQANPRVALGRAGGFVVWQTATTQDITQRVMVQRLAGDMTGAGLARRLSQSSQAQNEMRPVVAMLPDGGAVVAWESGARESADVAVRFLDASGNFLTQEMVANTHRSGIQGKPAVATLSSGEVVVVWSSAGQDGTGDGVYAQRFTVGGAKLGGEFAVNQKTAGNQSDPAVAGLKSGRFVVVWASEVASGTTAVGATDLRGTVTGRLFDAQGAAEGSEYAMAGGDVFSGKPALATTGTAGGFALAWEGRSASDVGSVSDIYVRAFSDAGLPLGATARHNTYLPGMQMAPAVAPLGTDVLVAWTSYGQDASGGGVQGRLLSGGKEFQINSQGQLHQDSPAMAADGQNKFLAVWVNTLRVDHSILSAQRYLANEGELAGVVDVTAGQVQVVQAPGTQRAISVEAARIQPKVSSPSTMEQSVGLPVSATIGRTAGTVPVAAVQPQPVAPPSARATSAGQQALLDAAQRTLAQRSAMARPTGATGGLTAASSSFSAARLPAASTTASRSLTGSAAGAGITKTTSPVKTTMAGKSATALSMASKLSAVEISQQARREQGTPVAASVIRTETGTVLEWLARAGAKYQVQGSDDLSNWANYGAVLTGAGQSESVALDAQTGPRYYRVLRTN